jgi:hypothetical protein
LVLAKPDMLRPPWPGRTVGHGQAGFNSQVCAAWEQQADHG